MKKHYLLLKLRRRSIEKKTGLPLLILKRIYRGRLISAIEEGTIRAFYKQNPTLSKFIKNYGTEKSSLEGLTADSDTMQFYKYCLPGRKGDDCYLGRDFYQTYAEFLNDWLDDFAPFSEKDRENWQKSVLDIGMNDLC